MVVESCKLEVGYRANELEIDDDNEREIVEQVVVQIQVFERRPHGSACLKLLHADFRDICSCNGGGVTGHTAS